MNLRLILLIAFWSNVDSLAVKSGRHNADAGGSEANVCVGGHLAPELLLYGPARASTSTFARNLVKSPGIMYGDCVEGDYIAPILGGRCPMIGWKEMHFFTTWNGSDKAKEEYVAHFPLCQQTHRLVAADLTPTQYVPRLIADFYADQQSRIKFIMLLRHPAKNLQSFYYYEDQDKLKPFADYVHELLASKHGGRYLENVMYADALQGFFQVFSPSQLVVAPMQYNEGEKDGQPRVTEFLWQQLGVPAAPAEDTPVDKWNVNLDGHKPLEEDLDPGSFAELSNFLDQLTGSRVVSKILADVPEKSRSGPVLYGYKGSPSDVDEIEAWIQDGW